MNPVAPHATRLGVWLALVTTLLVWASGFVGVSVAVSEYRPTSLALLRFLLASAALFLWLLRRSGRVPLPPARELRPLLLIGLFGVPLYHLPLNLGQEVVPAGTSSLLISTAPVFTALMAVLVLGERIGARTWTGIGIAFAGTALLVASRGPDRLLTVEPRAVLIVGAAAAFAVYAVLQRPLAQRYGGLLVATWSIWLGTLLLLPFVPDLLEDLRQASAAATLAAAYLGLAPGALGYVTYAHVLRHLPAAQAGSALYAVPPLATIMAWMLLGDRPPAMTLVSGAVVLCGVALANSGRRAASARPQRLPAPDAAVRPRGCPQA